MSIPSTLIYSPGSVGSESFNSQCPSSRPGASFVTGGITINVNVTNYQNFEMDPSNNRPYPIPGIQTSHSEQNAGPNESNNSSCFGVDPSHLPLQQITGSHLATLPVGNPSKFPELKLARLPYELNINLSSTIIENEKTGESTEVEGTLLPEKMDDKLNETMDDSSSSQLLNQDQEVSGKDCVPIRGEKRKSSIHTEDEGVIQKIETQLKPCASSKSTRHLKRCRECVNKKNTQIHIQRSAEECRFQLFRKIKIVESTKGIRKEFAGFCDPFDDPLEKDKLLWLPTNKIAGENLELNVCKDLLTQLGDQVCSLITQEQEALEIDSKFGDNRPKYWKPNQNIRELCDVCATTIFNYHWTCKMCGFVVCLGCFKARSEGVKKAMNFQQSHDEQKDEYQWCFCCKTQPVPHKPNELCLTQIIPGNILMEFGNLVHAARQRWSIPQGCHRFGCTFGSQPEKIDKTESAAAKTDFSKGSQPMLTVSGTLSNTTNPIDHEKNNTQMNSDDDDVDFDEFFGEPEDEPKETDVIEQCSSNLSGKHIHTFNEEEKKTVSVSLPLSSPKITLDLQECVKAQRSDYYDKSVNACKSYILSQTTCQYVGVEHMWLCSGTLLRLMKPEDPNNYKLFKQLWKDGQPVIVSNVGKRLTRSLWTPESFSRDYGHEKNDLINCMNSKTVKNMKVRNFWEGFEDIKKRVLDENGVPMLLKLKDWPQTEDFAKYSPERFEDLMQALPLQDYTFRTGRLNLAARLPETFIRPDLGPKMYIAYGDGNFLEKGTTNLHLDMSDAVNCMVYVGIPKNCERGHNEAITKAIQESDCDPKTIKEALKPNAKPGALWHIYRPWDAEKIRDLLNKICKEKGIPIEVEHDQIHDQFWYLDKAMRNRLRVDYDVVGFPIIQCEGDAVFIPAGAPHQVRNLNNCIKIAEDFVSPENVSHCFRLTEEFRNLSDTHQNHEDKLQIKSIVYHAVKDALSVLMNVSPDSVSNTQDV